MIGAIAGDIVGSRFEWAYMKSKDFELFPPKRCSFTDDSVMTIAIAAAQPFDALVNRGDERLSRVLDLIGGASAPDYAQFLDLCRKSLKPMPWHDIQGTCGRDDACECRSCWVRRGGYNDPKVLHKK